MTTKQLLDVDQAAERLGVSARFVRQLAYERRLTHFKLGKLVRFDPDDLDAWLAQCRVERIR